MKQYCVYESQSINNVFDILTFAKYFEYNEYIRYACVNNRGDRAFVRGTLFNQSKCSFILSVLVRLPRAVN